MKSVDQILEEFDERFTEKDAIGVGRWWQERIEPSFVRNFLRTYLNQMLDELEMEEGGMYLPKHVEIEEGQLKTTEGLLTHATDTEIERRIALEKTMARNQAAREQNQKIKKLKGDQTK